MRIWVTRLLTRKNMMQPTVSPHIPHSLHTHTQSTHPWQTDWRKLMQRSTASSQTLETFCWSNKEGMGRSCRMSSACCSTSEHRSQSSPERHARRRNAKAKDRAALVPSLARPSVAAVAESWELWKGEGGRRREERGVRRVQNTVHHYPRIFLENKYFLLNSLLS